MREYREIAPENDPCACVRRATRLVRALAGIYLARPDWLLTVAWTEGNQCVTGTRSWSPRNRTLGRGDN